MKETRDSGLVVEFLGLPRSGKSTLAHHVAQMLKSDGIKFEEPTRRYSLLPSPKERTIEKGKVLLLDLLNHPVRYTKYFNLIRKSKQNSMADYLKNLANWSFINHLLSAPLDSNSIRILDQGLFQAIWSIMLSAEELEIDLFQDAVPAKAPGKYLIVLLNASATRRSARSGGTSRMSSDPAKYTNHKAESVYNSVNLLARKLCAQSAMMRSISIDNETDNDLDRKASRVRDVIVGIIEG